MATADLDNIFLDFRLPPDAESSLFQERLITPLRGILSSATLQQWTASYDQSSLKPDFVSVLFTSTDCTCLATFYFDAKMATFSLQQKKVNAVFDSHAIRRFSELLEREMRFFMIRPEIYLPRISCVPQLFSTSDHRLCVYNFDRVLYNGNSRYQNIKVLHAVEFGNVLLLDDLINLAETDFVYTHSIMWKNVLSYKQKDVLILGGGDGGILNQVLKEQPHYVRMVEIDQQVIDVCRKFLRGACEGCLDSTKGDNYEIVIRDCFAELSDLINAQKKFDIVFSDLTDTPLTNDAETQKSFLTLIHKALEMGFRVLKPDGYFLTHLTGINDKKHLKTFEEILSTWQPAIQFERSQAMVPSYLETWCFYKIQLKT